VISLGPSEYGGHRADERHDGNNVQTGQKVCVGKDSALLPCDLYSVERCVRLDQPSTSCPPATVVVLFSVQSPSPGLLNGSCVGT
jgi:hypothetical protein